MLRSALTRPDPEDVSQPGVTPPGRHSAESRPSLSPPSLPIHPPHPPHPRPTPPTHSYTDMVSRMMFSDLHVLSLRKYSSSNQGLRK